MKLPTSLQLSPAEQGALRSLTRQELSAMDFWKQALRVRQIPMPADRVLMTVPLPTPGSYRLEWHSKPLGALSIAEGVRYRQFAAKKDREFSQRLVRQGKEVF